MKHGCLSSSDDRSVFKGFKPLKCRNFLKSKLLDRVTKKYLNGGFQSDLPAFPGKAPLEQLLA